MLNNLPLIVMQFPTGKWGYRGSIPRCLGNDVAPTIDDIMGGRYYTNEAGETVTTKFPVFASKRDALDHAFHNGIIIRED